LKKSEARYRLLAENSSDVIWTMTLEGQYTYVSPSIERLSGFTPEETLTLPMTKQFPSSAIKKLSEKMAKKLELPPANRKPGFTLELQQYTKDNAIIDTEVSISWVIDETGTPFGLQGITRDITHRK
jgi:PAS domain S-box-containing protein